jgi:putative PIN family toxin of toxin-antitoxin system
MPLRVVLDTNVVLSALLFASGGLGSLREAWQHTRCSPLVSAVTVIELRRALAYPKFKLTADEQQELLADYLPYATVVRMPPTPPKTPDCRDPFDIPFLQLAVVGTADHLVTGDKALLALAGRFERSIISPRELLHLLT